MLKDLWSIKPPVKEAAPARAVSSDIYAVAARDHAIPPRRHGRRK